MVPGQSEGTVLPGRHTWDGTQCHWSNALTAQSCRDWGGLDRTSPVRVTPSHNLRSSAWPPSQKWSQLLSWTPQNCVPVQPWHNFPIFHSTRFTSKTWLLACGIMDSWWRQGRTKVEWYLFRVVKWVENYQKEEKIEMKLPMMQFPWQLPFHLQF